ncbi:MAG TPA: N-acetylmuramoyl-L-alanine amidase-like domain-containing protein [Fimbriimonadaceae bacterium]|nr:N-acetylmuramoyl-L-alanine amidase-like domain-containing protein [Fimbriimonadaceae bacterium]
MLTRREFLWVALAAGVPLARSDSRDFVGEEVFGRLVARFGKGRAPIGLLTGEIGVAFLGTPYVGSTLELYDDRETCCVNLAGLDCVTFYELSLCLARMIRAGGSEPQDLVRQVELVRYRGGKLDGYLSRLHYTSDWIADNVAKKVVENLTPKLPGAVRMDKSFDFMSTHPSAYRQLRANPSWVPTMAAIEREIAARKPWYVPNAQVGSIEPRLQTGDIVGIATKAPGLDCSHTGLVYVDERGVRRFLNASSVRHEVVLGERLSDYAAKYSKNLGVMIARPL